MFMVKRDTYGKCDASGLSMRKVPTPVAASKSGSTADRMPEVQEPLLEPTEA
jgi:hypothetical protein